MAAQTSSGPGTPVYPRWCLFRFSLFRRGTFVDLHTDTDADIMAGPQPLPPGGNRQRGASPVRSYSTTSEAGGPVGTYHIITPAGHIPDIIQQYRPCREHPPSSPVPAAGLQPPLRARTPVRRPSGERQTHGLCLSVRLPASGWGRGGFVLIPPAPYCSRRCAGYYRMPESHLAVRLLFQISGVGTLSTTLLLPGQQDKNIPLQRR